MDRIVPLVSKRYTDVVNVIVQALKVEPCRNLNVPLAHSSNGVAERKAGLVPSLLSEILRWVPYCCAYPERGRLGRLEADGEHHPSCDEAGKQKIADGSF